MDQSLTLRILMGVVDKATAPLRRMGQAAAALRTPLGDTAGKLKRLEQTAGQVQKYRQLHTEVTRNKEALAQARARAETLGRAMAGTAAPTARMRAAFAAAKQQVERAADAQLRSSRQLTALRGQLAAAGVSARTLAADQRRLTSEIAAATAAAERQAAVVRRRAAVRQDMADNAARRGEMGGKLMDAAAGAIALAAPVAAAVKFESVMADVKKVVNFETPLQFKQMSDDVLLMSTRIPMAADGIGAIVAAAGQAGIAREELLRFAEDAAKMGVAFDLTGEQAGSAMTGLRTQFALSQDGVVSLGDAINHLSNNMDATAANLLDVANRTAGNARMFGLTGQQVSALGATFLALKSPPEVAATAINSMLGSLQTAPQQSKDFQKALEDLGLSAEYMKQAVKKDGQGALLTFLTAVKKAEDPMAILTDMFGSEFSDDVAKLVLSLDTYKKSLGLVADRTAYAGSMQDEYTARSETTANNLILLTNRTNRLGVSLGTILLPPLNTVANGLGVLADLVASLASKAPVLTKVLVGTITSLIALRIATIATGYAASFARAGWLQLRWAYVEVASGAALARVQSAAAAVTTRVSAVATRLHAWVTRQDAAATRDATTASRARGWAALEEAAAQIRARQAAEANRRASLLTFAGWKQLGAGAMQAAARGIGMATTAMRALTLATLTNPITWIAVGIAAAALLIYKYWQPLRAFFAGVWDGLKEGLAPLQSAFTPIMEAAADFKAAFGDVAGPVGKAWEAVKEALAPIGAALRPLIDSFGGLFDQVQMGAEELGALKDTGLSFGRVLAAGVRFALLPIRGLLLLVGTLAKALIWTASTVAKGVAAIWSVAGAAIMAPVRLAIAGTALLIQGWIWVAGQAATLVKGIASTWLSVTGAAVKGLDQLLQWSPLDSIAAAWDGVAAYFDRLWDGIVGKAQAAWDKVAGMVKSVRSLWPFGGNGDSPANDNAPPALPAAPAQAQPAPAPFVTPPAPPAPVPALRLVMPPAPAQPAAPAQAQPAPAPFVTPPAPPAPVPALRLVMPPAPALPAAPAQAQPAPAPFVAPPAPPAPVPALRLVMPPAPAQPAAPAQAQPAPAPFVAPPAPPAPVPALRLVMPPAPALPAAPAQAQPAPAPFVTPPAPPAPVPALRLVMPPAPTLPAAPTQAQPAPAPFVTPPPAPPAPVPALRLVTPPAPALPAAPAQAQPAPVPAASPIRIAPAAPAQRAPTITNNNSYQISVTATPGMSEQQLAREIRRQLEERDRAQASGARSAQYDRLSVGR